MYKKAVLGKKALGCGRMARWYNGCT